MTPFSEEEIYMESGDKVRYLKMENWFMKLILGVFLGYFIVRLVISIVWGV